MIMGHELSHILGMLLLSLDLELLPLCYGIKQPHNLVVI